MYPKVTSVSAIDERRLLVSFANGQRKLYDITPLLDTPMFAPLSNPAFFKTVRVEQGGYAVSWSNTIDISEYALWTNGTSINE